MIVFHFAQKFRTAANFVFGNVSIQSTLDPNAFDHTLHPIIKDNLVFWRKLLAVIFGFHCAARFEHFSHAWNIAVFVRIVALRLENLLDIRDASKLQLFQFWCGIPCIFLDHQRDLVNDVGPFVKAHVLLLKLPGS